jgi:hypothetical protein
MMSGKWSGERSGERSGEPMSVHPGPARTQASCHEDSREERHDAGRYLVSDCAIVQPVSSSFNLKTQSRRKVRGSLLPIFGT